MRSGGRRTPFEITAVMYWIGAAMEEREREVQETQIEPVAGIWACSNCGCRIQVITESAEVKVQPFVCTCGTPMEPGEEHSELSDANEPDSDHPRETA